MGGRGKSIVPCWIKYPVQQHVSSVNAGEYGSTQCPDQHQKLMLNKVLGPPFSVADWESKRAHSFSGQEIGKY